MKFKHRYSKKVLTYDEFVKLPAHLRESYVQLPDDFPVEEGDYDDVVKGKDKEKNYPHTKTGPDAFGNDATPENDTEDAPKSK